MAKKYEELVNYNIIFEGTLKKSPPQKSKAFFNFITKRWRNRHFVLYKTARSNGVYLVYFKLEPTNECKNIGEINLVNLKNVSVDVGSTVHRSNVFSIHTSDEKGDDRIYYLCAQTSGLMNMWVDNIVSSLNLNTQSSKYSTISTTCSPTSQSSPKDITRIAPNYVFAPKLKSGIWSPPTSPDTSRFSFPTPSENSNENAESSYYNLSPNAIPLFKDELEDPISNEEEDIYKYPCENNNSHAYVNLGDGETNLIALENNMFFPNDGNFMDCTNNSRTTPKLDFRDSKEPPDYLACDYNYLPDYHSDIKVCKLESSDNKPTGQESCDFNFLLPTRIRNHSESSSSSSNSSSSKDNVGAYQLPVRMKTYRPPSPDDKPPPRVPKRLNLPDINSANKNPMMTETVLPIKTPKSFFPKNETTDATFSDESFSALNYLDAGNLLLENGKIPVVENSHDSTYSSLHNFPSIYSTLPTTSSDLKAFDFQPRCDTPVIHNIDEGTPSSLFSFVKEVIPSVEYREICDARTEALRKLNVRIFNNE